MKAKKSGRKKRSSPKELGEIITDDWLAQRRAALDRAEEVHKDRTDISFISTLGMVHFYRCFTEIALEYVPRPLILKVLRDTETVCKRAGFTMTIKSDVGKCLVRNHEECRGIYYNPVMEAVIKCGCSCHKH